MLTKFLAVGGVVASAVVLHSSIETVVTDTIVGVTIAVALFVLYYALVLRRASGGHGRNGST